MARSKKWSEKLDRGGIQKCIPHSNLKNGSLSLRTLIPIVILSLFCGSLAGCSNGSGNPAVIPVDPLCGIIPAEEVAAMLQSGVYLHKITQGRERDDLLRYYEKTNVIDGKCLLSNQETGLTDIGIFADSGLGGEWRVDGCNGPRLDLEPPRLGVIEASLSCQIDEEYVATATYWGRAYDVNDEPFPTHIQVYVVPRAGRDGVADATRIVQLLIDYMERNYQSALASDTPPPPPQSSEGRDGLRDATLDCAETWLNTEASPELISLGQAEGVITHNSDTGRYLVDRTRNAFFRWTTRVDGDPWFLIEQGMLFGMGCPFGPTTEDPIRVDTAIDCLNTYLGQVHNSQELTAEGLAIGTLTQDSAKSQYHVQASSEHISQWLQDNDIPWREIRAEVIYGSGKCGYSQ